MIPTLSIVVHLLLCVCLGEILATSEIRVSNIQDCPLWNTYNTTAEECQCGKSLLGTIQCSDKDNSVSVKSCYCMTFDNDTLNSVVAFCFYTCSTLYKNYLSNFFHKIRTNMTTELNKEVCGWFNRRGTMCGECIEGYGLPVYSYSLSCVECTHYKYNWIKYIAVAYIPLTLFLIVVITFRISATSGSMVGYVTVSQLVATRTLVTLYYVVVNKSKWILGYYSIWNLDFFRAYYPPFCIHPNMPALQVVSLDYIVAVYPMIMILLTYVVITLRDHFSLVMWLCRPMYTCLHRFRKEWEVNNSLIGAFATMLLLSYVKILNVTYDILTPRYLHYMNGSHSKYYVANDINTPYLSETHLPYFILALAMSFVFNIVPLLLLCLYPCRCFQRCLNRTGLQYQALYTFMDAFQGCYKHKPYNLRYFSAYFFLVQITNMTIFLLDEIRYHPSASYMLTVVVIALCIARPYRNKWHSILLYLLFYYSFTF